MTELWSKIVSGQGLDLTLYDKNSRMIAVDTIKHRNVREIGTEWICNNTRQKLEIDQLLEENGFTELEKRFAKHKSSVELFIQPLS